MGRRVRHTALLSCKYRLNIFRNGTVTCNRRLLAQIRVGVTIKRTLTPYSSDINLHTCYIDMTVESVMYA
jgi:hypothetical protein